MPEMTSRLSKGQTIAVLAWLPAHVLLLPILASLLYLRGSLDEAEATFLVYAVGAAYMLLVLLRFFRHDFKRAYRFFSFFVSDLSVSIRISAAEIVSVFDGKCPSVGHDPL